MVKSHLITRGQMDFVRGTPNYKSFYNYYSFKFFASKLTIILSLVGDDYSITSDGNCLKLCIYFNVLHCTQNIVLVFILLETLLPGSDYKAKQICGDKGTIGKRCAKNR